MFSKLLEEHDVINSVDIGFNYIPAYFYNAEKRLYYIILINPSDKKHKIATMKNKLDLFFYKKYSFLKKQNNFIQDTNSDLICFGKDEEGQNNLYLPPFYPLINNLNLEIKTNRNLVNKININFSSYNNHLRFNEIPELNFFNKNFFRFNVLDLFVKNPSHELSNYKNLIQYLNNLRDHLSVFINLFYYTSEHSLFNKIFNTQMQVDFILKSISTKNIGEYLPSIKDFCKEFLNSSLISAFLDKRSFKKDLYTSCIVSKKDAFYNSASGVVLRASGIDLDFMPYKSRKNIIGKVGGTWDRFNIRYIEIKVLLSEILLLINNISNFELPTVSKKGLNSFKHYYQTENANGLFLTYMEYDTETEKLFLKINNPSINNLNLIEYALKSKSMDFSYFLISLNIKNQELNLSRPLLINHPFDSLDFIYE